MTQTLTSTPAADGFWMPAEFEAHAGCWMLWPERPDNWREAARPAQHAFAAVAAAIAEFEPVTVGVSSSEFQVARALLDPRVRVLEMSTTTVGCATWDRRLSSIGAAQCAAWTGISMPGAAHRVAVFPLGPG